MTPPTDAPPSEPPPPSPLRRYWPWLVLLLILVLTAAVRIRLLDVPLERDEGEYAYAGQLLLQGIPPYAQAYNMKMPGIYAAYALILAVFGETHRGIHVGLLVINTATILLLLLLGRRLFDSATGVIAAAAYAILSLSMGVLGFTANAEPFVVLPAVGGVLVLLRAVESPRWINYFWSGLLLGLAFTMKQHGVFYIIFGGLYLLYADCRIRPFRWSRCLGKQAAFAAGVFLPFGLICLLLALAGVFDKFWFWVFQYAAQYVTVTPISVGIGYLPLSIWLVIKPALLLWVFAVIGLILAPVWDRQARSRLVFSLMFFLCTFLCVFPGFYFREHYFILMIPAVALSAAVGIRFLSRLPFLKTAWQSGSVALGLTVAAVGYTVHQEWAYLVQWTPYQVARVIYGGNPFPESLEIAAYLRKHTTETDRIAVIGSEPQIYFYARRRAATGHIYTYALMEPQPFAGEMQREMIREIEAARPEFLIYVNVNSSWLKRPSSDRTIFHWFDHYQEDFEQVGLMWIDEDLKVGQCWDGEAKGVWPPDGTHWVSILRRKKTPL